MLWLSEPETQFYLRPELYSRAVGVITGAPPEGQGNVMTGDYYGSALRFAQSLAEALADNDLPPSDMIDVQGFLWGVCSRSQIWFGGKSYGGTTDMLPEFIRRQVYATGYAKRSEVSESLATAQIIWERKDATNDGDCTRAASDGNSSESERKAITAFFDLACSPESLILAKSVFYNQSAAPIRHSDLSNRSHR